MSKELTPFEATIQNHLNLIASKDTLFAESLKKANKNIKECVKYIYDTVRKSGRIGFNDDEIFNMAIHYYDEDDIKDIKTMKCQVVVNHSQEITDISVGNPPKTKDKPKKAVKPKVKESKPIEQLSMF